MVRAGLQSDMCQNMFIIISLCKYSPRSAQCKARKQNEHEGVKEKGEKRKVGERCVPLCYVG